MRKNICFFLFLLPLVPGYAQHAIDYSALRVQSLFSEGDAVDSFTYWQGSFGNAVACFMVCGHRGEEVNGVLWYEGGRDEFVLYGIRRQEAVTLKEYWKDELETGLLRLVTESPLEMKGDWTNKKGTMGYSVFFRRTESFDEEVHFLTTGVPLYGYTKRGEDEPTMWHSTYDGILWTGSKVDHTGAGAYRYNYTSGRMPPGKAIVMPLDKSLGDKNLVDFEMSEDREGIVVFDGAEYVLKGPSDDYPKLHLRSISSGDFGWIARAELPILEDNAGFDRYVEELVMTQMDGFCLAMKKSKCDSAECKTCCGSFYGDFDLLYWQNDIISGFYTTSAYYGDRHEHHLHGILYDLKREEPLTMDKLFRNHEDLYLELGEHVGKEVATSIVHGGIFVFHDYSFEKGVTATFIPTEKLDKHRSRWAKWRKIWK